MKEIAYQIIELGKLIGKKVFVKHYADGSYYNDSDVPEIFTNDDFEYYAYDLLNGEISLTTITYTPKFGKYYLVTFNDL